MSVEAFADEVRDMLRVGQAAKFLGVTPETLRNWDRAGRLIPRRHPLTGYRYYDPADLRSFLERSLSRRGAVERDAGSEIK